MLWFFLSKQGEEREIKLGTTLFEACCHGGEGAPRWQCKACRHFLIGRTCNLPRVSQSPLWEPLHYVNQELSWWWDKFGNRHKCVWQFFTGQNQCLLEVIQYRQYFFLKYNCLDYCNPPLAVFFIVVSSSPPCAASELMRTSQIIRGRWPICPPPS